MIIGIEDIKAIRPIYDSLDSEERVLPYIREAEVLFIIPAIGAATFKAIEETPEAYTLVLDGGFYQDERGETQYLTGLKKAAAYLAYSRLVTNQQVSVTTYGVDYMQSEYSQRVDTKALTYQSNEAKEVGMQILSELQKYLNICNCKKKSEAGAKIRVID